MKKNQHHHIIMEQLQLKNISFNGDNSISMSRIHGEMEKPNKGRIFYM